MLYSPWEASLGIVSFFIPIFEAVLAGYLAVLFVYTGMLLLITRLGRAFVMRDDRVSPLSTLLLCITWLVASLAGAWICCTLAPMPPYGAHLFPSVVAGISAFILLRNTQLLRRQQTVFATIAMGLMIGAGTVGGLYLKHAL